MDEILIALSSQADTEALRKILSLVSGLAPKEMDTALRVLARDVDAGHRGIAFYLYEMSASHGFRILGFSSITHYASARFGFGKSLTADLVFAGRELRVLEAIDAAFCSGRLDWSKVRVLVRIATRETEAEWLAAAENGSCRELERLAANAQKGQRPPKGGKGLPPATIKINTRYSISDFDLWTKAKHKLEEEIGEPLSDADCGAMLARLHLSRVADGSIPGWKPAAESLTKVLVSLCSKCDSAELMTDEGTTPLPEWRKEMLLCDSTVDHTDPDHHPHIDMKTPSALRRLVLARDGNRCRCCGSRENLHAHHIVFRSSGGPTTAGNLSAVCELCHGNIHEGLLRIAGKAPKELRFLDREGRDLSDRGEPVGAVLRKIRRAALSEARAAEGAAPELDATKLLPAALSPESALIPGVVSIETIPATISHAWWVRHSHLFSWNERKGTLEFTSGGPIEPIAVPEPTRATEPSRSEKQIRPERFADIIGQSDTVRSLSVAVNAAKIENRCVPHLLLYGPPGTGKTTFARAIAHEMGTAAKEVAAPFLRDPAAFLGLLLSAQRGDTVFVDEIHSLPARVTEALYEALEDRTLSLEVADGLRARTLYFQLEPFTFVAATTEPGELSEPFRARFPIHESLELYTPDELALVVTRAKANQPVALAPDAARLIGAVSRGTPRTALNYLGRIHDHTLDAHKVVITAAGATAALAAIGVDERGLTRDDRKVLNILQERGPNRPISFKRLALLSGIATNILASIIEPFLIRSRLITVTPHGRVVTSSFHSTYRRPTLEYLSSSRAFSLEYPQSSGCGIHMPT